MMTTFKRTDSRDILVVCENADHDFFIELNQGNQLGLIERTVDDILEDVGIAVIDDYNDIDMDFPTTTEIDLCTNGGSDVRITAHFKLKNIGRKDEKTVLSYVFEGCIFDYEYYPCEFSEEIFEIMVTLNRNKQ